MNAVDDKSVGWTEALGEHASNPVNPRTSGKTIKALGRDWMISSCEARIKAQFEQWVRANAESLWINHPNPEIGRLLMNGYMECYAAGHYSWPQDVPHEEAGRAVRGALADFAGMKYMFYLLLRRCQVIDEKTAVKILETAKDQSLLAIRWALGNSQAPQEGANGQVTETMDGP